MKLRRKLGLGIGLLFAGLLIWPVVAHYRAKSRLAEHKHQLIERGEKLTIKELAPVPTDAAVNALQRLAIVVSALGNAPTSAPPSMGQVTNGSAIVAWLQPIYPTEDSSNTWAALDLEFSGKDEKLSELRDILRADGLASLQDYSLGFSMAYQHLPNIKRSAQWLSAGVQRDLHDRAGSNAFENLRALASLARSYDADITVIGVLVRLAVCAIGADSTWAALQSPDITADQWKEIQETWEEVDLLIHAEQALGMERTMVEDLIARGRISYAAIGQAFGTSTSAMSDLTNLTNKALEEPGETIRGFSHRFPGYWRWKLWGSYEDELVNSLTTQAGIDLIREARSNASGGPLLRLSGELKSIRNEHPKAGAWMGMTWEGSMPPLFARLLDVQTHQKLMLTAIALKRFQLTQGKLPGGLGELSPGFIPKPILDVDAKPLRYQRNADQTWKLYSVGMNGQDDGGSALPHSNAPADARRWTRWKDAVWPQPADPGAELQRSARANQKRMEKEAQHAHSASGMEAEAKRRFLERYGLQP